MAARLFNVVGWLTWVLTVVPAVSGYGTGAPDGRCSSMVPGHGSSSKTYTDPFSIIVNSATYSPSSRFQRSRTDIYIRGFFIQARPAEDRNANSRLGYFSSGSGTRTACNNGAITHAYSANRSNVTVSWRAPAGPQGDIVFRATVVRVYSDYYTEIYSPVISYQTPTTLSTTTTTPSSTTTTTSTTTETTRKTSPSPTTMPTRATEMTSTTGGNTDLPTTFTTVLSGNISTAPTAGPMSTEQYDDSVSRGHVNRRNVLLFLLPLLLSCRVL